MTERSFLVVDERAIAFSYRSGKIEIDRRSRKKLPERVGHIR
jgi:hypothetical protein